MRRLLWLLTGVAFLATGLWLTGRPPSAYVLGKECERYHEMRRDQYTFLVFQIAQADEAARPALRNRVDELLAETKRMDIRGWEIVLVPPGARAPGAGYSLAHRLDCSLPPDPPPLKGETEAWIAPRSWFARLFLWKRRA